MLPICEIYTFLFILHEHENIIKVVSAAYSNLAHSYSHSEWVSTSHLYVVTQHEKL